MSEPTNTPDGTQPLPGQQPYSPEPGYGQQPYGAQAPYGQQPYAPQAPSQPAYGQQGYAQPYAAPGTPTNTMAIVSLISGIAGATVIFFVGSIVAIITGHMARKQIAASGEQGSGMAVAGLVLGYVVVGLTVLGGLFFVLIFGLAAATSTG
ncbi:DUF4190 domain-containing protein [Actinotalea sp.]|uniref:DUF4190 domain-containing protein n=1 Tax=Actinotalea sp. TaxID=1872145 RepID=UPI0035680258